ncbi:MAG: SDR family oxidoreductase [Actinomycetota bacterium]|nr:SDR family oxidoreductase [Actinomycetota bacterium]
MTGADSPFDLTGRVALVTGSSRGIGRSLAEGLGGAGAIVVLNGRDEVSLVRARDELVDAGVTVHVAAFDVTRPEAVTEAVAGIEADVGPIDVLLNNAGIQRRAPLLDVDLDAFREVLDANLTSAFLVGQAVARHMADRGRGRIVNVCSVLTSLARPGTAPYAVSKGGLAQLTRAMCAELGPLGIGVNAIAPGYIVTEMTAPLVDDPEFSAWITNRTPAGRWGRVDELQGATVFLASDAAGFVNGQVLYVDGGMTAVL